MLKTWGLRLGVLFLVLSVVVVTGGCLLKSTDNGDNDEPKVATIPVDGDFTEADEMADWTTLSRAWIISRGDEGVEDGDIKVGERAAKTFPIPKRPNGWAKLDFTEPIDVSNMSFFRFWVKASQRASLSIQIDGIAEGTAWYALPLTDVGTDWMEVTIVLSEVKEEIGNEVVDVYFYSENETETTYWFDGVYFSE